MEGTFSSTAITSTIRQLNNTVKMSIKVIAFLAFACLQAGSLNGALLRSGNDCDAYKSSKYPEN